MLNTGNLIHWMCVSLRTKQVESKGFIHVVRYMQNAHFVFVNI